MRKILFLFMMAFALLNVKANNSVVAFLPTSPAVANTDVSPEFQKFVTENMKTLVNMTPAEYKKITGKKLSVKETVMLKMAQKKMKKEMKAAGGDVPKGVYIVLAILGWAWLIMGIKDDWSGKNWWVNLLLTVLCWLPGVIHAFVKMKDYYGNK